MVGTSHTWLTMTAQSGYIGTAYLQARPDLDALYPTGAITGSPKTSYPLYVTTPAPIPSGYEAIQPTPSGTRSRLG